MVTRVCVVFMLLLGIRAWSQIGSGGSGSNPAQMQTPPIAGGGMYDTQTGSEERSNFFSLGMSETTAFDDNVAGGGGSAQKPVSDVSFMIHPSISLNTTTPRQAFNLSYTPGFTFYRPTSELDTSTEAVAANYHYRLSPHIGLDANESFTKTAGIFSLGDQLPGGPITGAPQPSPVVAPFAETLIDTTTGGITYQFSLRSMVGANGIYSRLSFPIQTEASGLGNSDLEGFTGFYNTRLSKNQYLGLKYDFAHSVQMFKGGQSETVAQSFSPFYSIFFGPRFSASISAGPQHTVESATGAAEQSKSWGPAVSGSLGWQATRFTIAASALRMVAGGSGLVGEFQTTSANATARWRATQNWTLSAQANYQIQKDAAPGIFVGNLGGHTLQGGVQAGRRLGERFQLGFGYNRIHQSYPGAGSINAAPDDDHDYVSISYSLTRPLGR